MARPLSVLIGLLLLVAAAPWTSAAYARDIIYIFDASGSMWAQMSGRTRIEIARDVLADQIPSLKASQTNAGLIVYGHRERGNCADIEEMVPLKPLDERELVAKIESIQPKGKTPIAASIRLATSKLRTREDEATIVLVSDGAENCDPDPCQVVTDLKSAGISFVLHVVGFDVAVKERRQLQCLARAGGGRYVSASNAAELTVALQEVVPLQPVVLSQENIEIILDGSVQMKQPFDQATRLEAAKKSVSDVLELQVPDRDKLAFRSFGGPCSARGTVLHVDFAQNNVNEIREHLLGIAVQGRPTLANAVIAAAQDFQQERQFPEQVNKKVIVIAGSGDGCAPRRAADRIHRALQRHSIKPDFHFIGLNMPPDKLAQYRRVAGAAGGSLYNLKTAADLTRVLKRIIEVDPVIASTRLLVDILNRFIDEMNRAIGAINAKNYQGAEASIAKASDLMDGGNSTFADLGKRADSSKVFGDIYGLASRIRQLQHERLILAGRLVDLGEDNDVDAFNAAVGELNENTRKSSELVRLTNAALRKL